MSRMAKKKKARDDSEERSSDFEASMLELEAIVKRLELGNGTLDEALADYGSAIQLLKTCHQKLDHAERRIELLSGVDAEGNPVSEPFEATAEDLESKRSARSSRRSAQSNENVSKEQGLF